jgi:hypothetical protein
MTAPSADDPDVPAWPDWRDAEQYRHMLDLDRAGWAWEWLRRNPDYAGLRQERPVQYRGRTAQPASAVPQLTIDSAALRWGLCFHRGAGSPRPPRPGNVGRRKRSIRTPRCRPPAG